MLFELLVVVIKVTELIGQDVGIWAKVKRVLTEPLLQTHNIKAKSVLSRDFIALREMIDLLVLI